MRRVSPSAFYVPTNLKTGHYNQNICSNLYGCIAKKKIFRCAQHDRFVGRVERMVMPTTFVMLQAKPDVQIPARPQRIIKGTMPWVRCSWINRTANRPRIKERCTCSSAAQYSKQVQGTSKMPCTQILSGVLPWVGIPLKERPQPLSISYRVLPSNRSQ